MEILGGNEERPSFYHILEIHRKGNISLTIHGWQRQTKAFNYSHENE